MTDSSAPLPRRERQALCDTAERLHPAAPTLCGDWDLSELLAHLIVRERRLLEAGGIMVPALARFTERAVRQEAAKGVPAMIATLRKPPLSPYSMPWVERFTQTMEYVVHHEDIRRAQPGWEPRDLPERDLDELWTLLGRSGSYLGRNLPVPTRLARAGAAGSAGSVRFKRGPEPVLVTGPVVELVMWVYGRSEVRGLSFDGPADAVARLQGSDRAV